VKIPDIVSYYILAAGGKRQFQDHVIIRVGEEGPPQEMDFLQVTLAGEVANEPQSIVCVQSRRQIFWTGELAPWLDRAAATKMFVSNTTRNISRISSLNCFYTGSILSPGY
jgi:hypothetical protein